MLDNYLDDCGKINVLPRKKSDRQEVYHYIAEKFEKEKMYTEKEVNEIIQNWHVFNNTCLIRRELIEYKLLIRNDNGTCYQKNI